MLVMSREELERGEQQYDCVSEKKQEDGDTCVQGREMAEIEVSLHLPSSIRWTCGPRNLYVSSEWDVILNVMCYIILKETISHRPKNKLKKATAN